MYNVNNRSVKTEFYCPSLQQDLKDGPVCVVLNFFRCGAFQSSTNGKLLQRRGVSLDFIKNLEHPNTKQLETGYDHVN